MGFEFWRERFRASGIADPAGMSFDDFACLPVLEREELPTLFAEARARSAHLTTLVMRTGGSTGIPAEVLFGPEELGWSESASAYFRERIGLPPSPRTAFVWGHNLDPVARASRRERIEDYVFQQRWFDIFRIDEDTLRRYDKELAAFRPELILAYAGALDALAGVASTATIVPRPYPTHAIITGAEKLHPAQRRRIEAVFAAPVHEQYGGRDVGLMAYQASATDPTLTVDWQNTLIEPETPDHEAAVLVTKLHADAMPMFRYRIGDMAVFPNDAKPGHASFTLPLIVGRELNMLWRADGSRVSGMFFPHMLKDFPLREFQVRQSETLDVTVLVAPREGFSDRDEVEILRLVRDNLPGCPVRLERVAEVPRGSNRKLHPVIAPRVIRPLTPEEG